MSSHPTTAPDAPRRRFGRHAVTAAAIVGVALTAPAVGAAVALGTLTEPRGATGASGTVLVTGQAPSNSTCQTPAVSVEQATPTSGLVSVNVKAVPDASDAFVPGNSVPDGTIAAPAAIDGRRDSSTVSQAFHLAPATFARNAVTAAPATAYTVSTTFARNAIAAAPAAFHAMSAGVTAAFH